MSRLTSLPRGTKARAAGLGSLSFRDFGDWVLLTNDWGRWQMLDKPDFERFLAGGVEPGEPLHEELSERGFVSDRMDFGDLAASYVKQTSFRFLPGPSLHMIVVTLRCNQKCRYCHSSVVDPSRTDTD
ncbi:MAG TPA: hypothetical protein VH309_01215, partial [Elusimicrobiota bacterium]|nr:hypothetical protein [Elusimicrobiota bacterium]